MTKPNAIEEIIAKAVCAEGQDCCGAPNDCPLGWDYMASARECLAALDAAGLAVVPIQATEEMIKAAWPPREVADGAWLQMATAFDLTKWKPKP